jgi:glucose dehydrogenase
VVGQDDDDAQWPIAAKNYANTRYSSLDQINVRNVKNLKLSWTFSTGVTRGEEAAPLVVHNTMYVVTAYPNLVYALDLTRAGAPLKWTYKPQPAAAAQGVACCDVVNRGAAYSHGKVFINTLDNHTIAIDADDLNVLENNVKLVLVSTTQSQLAVAIASARC